MTIKFIRQWHQFAPGRITDTLGSGVASELVRRGIAEQMVDVSGGIIAPLEIVEKYAKAIEKPKRNKQIVEARNK